MSEKNDIKLNDETAQENNKIIIHSHDEYRDEMTEENRSLHHNIFLTLFLIAFSILILYALFATDTDDFSIKFAAFFIVIGISYWNLKRFKKLFASITAWQDKSYELKEIFKKSAPEEFLKKEKVKKKKIALSYFDNGEYSKAIETFESIEKEDFKSTNSYINLCKAYIYNEKMDYGSAVYYIEKVTLSEIDGERYGEAVSLSGNIHDTCDEIVSKRKEEKRLSEKIEKMKTPYIGMFESEISQTGLGTPSSVVRHNMEMINGKNYTANIYDFVQNGYVIFVARCAKGKVINIWDYREDPYKYVTSTKRYVPDYDEDDPYNATDYYDPEDFYEDNYDDFYDYEEAEEYYYEHN